MIYLFVDECLRMNSKIIDEVNVYRDSPDSEDPECKPTSQIARSWHWKV